MTPPELEMRASGVPSALRKRRRHLAGLKIDVFCPIWADFDDFGPIWPFSYAETPVFRGFARQVPDSPRDTPSKCPFRPVFGGKRQFGGIWGQKRRFWADFGHF